MGCDENPPAGTPGRLPVGGPKGSPGSTCGSTGRCPETQCPATRLAHCDRRASIRNGLVHERPPGEAPNLPPVCRAGCSYRSSPWHRLQCNAAVEPVAPSLRHRPSHTRGIGSRAATPITPDSYGSRAEHEHRGNCRFQQRRGWSIISRPSFSLKYWIRCFVPGNRPLPQLSHGKRSPSSRCADGAGQVRRRRSALRQPPWAC